MRVRYDGLDSAVDVEMGSRKIHTLAVRVADYAGAVFPPVVSLLFLPSFHIFSISLALSVIFACRVFLRIPLSVNVIMGGIEGGGGRRGLKSVPFGVYIVSQHHLNCCDEIKTHLVPCLVVGSIDYPELCMDSSASD